MVLYGVSSPAFLNEEQFVKSSAVRPVSLAVVVVAGWKVALPLRRSTTKKRSGGEGWDKLHEDVEVH
jgi:hypothetical protein